MLLAHLEYALDKTILTQRVLRFRVGALDVAQACDRITAKLSKTQPVAGFRKGKAPLPVVRKELWPRIAGEAFQELKRAALDQVLQRLEDADRPLIPPEVLDEGRIKLKYDEMLEFAVKYLVDPAGITKNPAQPEVSPGPALPGAAVQHAMLQPASMPGMASPPAIPLPPKV